MPGADRLVFVAERIDRLDVDQGRPSFMDFVDLRAQQTVFEDVAAFHWTSLNMAGEEGPPERVSGAMMSANALELVGVQPLLGRVFRDGEDEPDASPLIVLSYGLWQNRFAGDPAVVGRTIRVNGAATEVIGVMPEGFHFPFDQVAWMPFHFDAATMERRAVGLDVFGRRLDGVSAETVAAALGRISADIEAVHPQDNEGVRMWAAPSWRSRSRTGSTTAWTSRPCSSPWGSPWWQRWSPGPYPP